MCWVVENTPQTSEDTVGEWSFVRFLNRLQYLTQKQEVLDFERTKNT